MAAADYKNLFFATSASDVNAVDAQLKQTRFIKFCHSSVIEEINVTYEYETQL